MLLLESQLNESRRSKGIPVTRSVKQRILDSLTMEKWSTTCEAHGDLLKPKLELVGIQGVEVRGRDNDLINMKWKRAVGWGQLIARMLRKLFQRT